MKKNSTYLENWTEIALFLTSFFVTYDAKETSSIKNLSIHILSLHFSLLTLFFSLSLSLSLSLILFFLL